MLHNLSSCVSVVRCTSQFVENKVKTIGPKLHLLYYQDIACSKPDDDTKLAVISGWEKQHTIFPLLVTGTLVNHV